MKGTNKETFHISQFKHNTYDILLVESHISKIVDESREDEFFRMLDILTI